MSISINRQHPRLYRIWAAIKQRCTNPNCTTFARYGGRGITVCNEWSSTFAVFARWALAAGYADHLSIDRIDNNGNYEPENCRWATKKQQARNTRRTATATIDGVESSICDIAEQAGLSAATVHSRKAAGWPDALLTVPAAKGRIATRSDRPDLGCHARGERNGRAKLKALDVAKIKASTESYGYWARRLGVDKTTIRDIRAGTIWAHVMPYEPGKRRANSRKLVSNPETA